MLGQVKLDRLSRHSQVKLHAFIGTCRLDRCSLYTGLLRLVVRVLRLNPVLDGLSLPLPLSLLHMEVAYKLTDKYQPLHQLDFVVLPTSRNMSLQPSLLQRIVPQQ